MAITSLNTHAIHKRREQRVSNFLLGILLIPLSACPLELERQVLDQRCSQFGYNSTAVSNARTYVSAQRRQQKSDAVIKAELEEQYRNDALNFCQPGRSLSSLVQHVTDDGFTVMPHFSGGTFLNGNWLLSGPENWDYYQYRQAKGVLAVENTLGFRTNRMGISIDGHSDIDRVLDAISRNRLAGIENIWAVFYLKANCCTDKTMPALFRGNSSQPPDPQTIYQRIENYCAETSTRLLNESELPIGLVAIGNEIDGGFFDGFDAGPYDGPPDNMGRTKKIVQACRNGVVDAYANQGLARPFFQLHLMPAVSRSYNTNRNLIRNFLSEEHVGEKLFDHIGFSLYPGGRPIAAQDVAWRLRTLGEDMGLPWGIVEMGMAQMRAPGLSDQMYAWNNGVSTQACVPMIGRPCNNLLERQKVELETLHQIFMDSPTFFSSIYLNPTGNIIFHLKNDSNGNGRWDVPEPYRDLNTNWRYDPGESYDDLNHNGSWDEGEQGHEPSHQYRIALWRYEDAYSGIGHGQAQITPAHQAYEKIMKTLTAPKIKGIYQNCPSEDDCQLILAGRNFSANSRIKLKKANGKTFVERYHSDQIHRVNQSILILNLRSKDAKVLRDEGLSVEVVRDDPWHFTVSNRCALLAGQEEGSCS